MPTSLASIPPVSPPALATSLPPKPYPDVLRADVSLHNNELAIAIQNSLETGGYYKIDLIGIKKTINSLPEIERSYGYCVHLHATRFITDKV